MPSQIVVSNDWLNTRCEAARAILNDSHILALFQNDITPDPTTEFDDFEECDFDTYSAISLDDGWTEAIKVVEGQWRTSTDVHSWDSPVATGGQIVGWFIYETPSNVVKMSQRFFSTLNFEPGDDEFSLQINFEDFAKSIL